MARELETRLSAFTRAGGVIGAVLIQVLLLMEAVGPPAEAQGPASMRPEEVSRRYLATLQDFARGQDTVSSAKALGELMVRVDPIPALRRQWAAVQRDLLRQLETRCGRECLVPMWFLYQDLARLLDQNGFEQPAGRVLGVLEDLEEAYVTELPLEDSSPEPLLVARLRTRFALGLIQDRRLEQALEVLEKALKRGPQLEVALRAAAAIEEKQADYRAAEAYLDRLLTLRPGDAEARLRRAHCRLRTGRVDESLSSLGDLTDPDSGAPAWVRTMAFQELVRASVAAGRREEAARWLETARKVDPEDQGLKVLEAAQAPQSSTQGRRQVEAVVARVHLGSDLETCPGPSARRIYNRWPTAGMEAFDLALQEDLDRHRTVLRAWLEKTAGSRAMR